MPIQKITPISYITHGSVYKGSVSGLFDGQIGIAGSGADAIETPKGLILSGASNIGFVAIDLGNNFSEFSLKLSAYSGTGTWSTMTIKNFKIQGNNNSTSNTETWTDIYTGTTSSNNAIDEFTILNPQKYRYIRLFALDNWGYSGYISMSEVEIYAFIPYNKILLSSNNKYYSIEKGSYGINTVIPKMTSNTSPSGIASASNIYSTTYDAWKAFDNSDTTTWNTLANVNTNQWVQYMFVDMVTIGKYSLTPSAASTTAYRQMPKDWTFEGSNNGMNWYILDTQINQSWTAKEYKTYEFINIIPYKYYRLNIKSNNGYSNIVIGELKMFEFFPPKLKQLSVLSDNNFTNYGQDILDNLNTTILSKTYILQDSISEDTDGLWKQELNRKPLSIKFE